MEDLVLSCLESRVEENRNLYARFLVGPFLKGDALTVATALRRVLLSSVESIGITALYIQGITHEFSTIVGVRESVLELSLNFGAIVLSYDRTFFQKKSFFDKLQIGYLQVQGPKVIYANHLKLPLGVKLVDPTQYIATVSKEGSIVLKFIISKRNNFLHQGIGPELHFENGATDLSIVEEVGKKNIVRAKKTCSYKNGSTINSFVEKKPYKYYADMQRLSSFNKSSCVQIKDLSAFAEGDKLCTYTCKKTDNCTFKPVRKRCKHEQKLLAKNYKRNVTSAIGESLDLKSFYESFLRNQSFYVQVQRRQPLLSPSESWLRIFDLHEQSSTLQEDLYVRAKICKKRRFTSLLEKIKLVKKPFKYKDIGFAESKSSIFKRNKASFFDFFSKGKLITNAKLHLYAKGIVAPFKKQSMHKLCKKKKICTFLKTTFKENFCKTELRTPLQAKICAKSNGRSFFKEQLQKKANTKKNEIKQKNLKFLSKNNVFKSNISLRNVIPLDLTLTPVLKVNFVVEIDDEVLYLRQKIRERIILEVWTNGSINPRQAVHDSSLRLLDIFASFRSIYQVTST